MSGKQKRRLSIFIQFLNDKKLLIILFTVIFNPHVEYHSVQYIFFLQYKSLLLFISCCFFQNNSIYGLLRNNRAILQQKKFSSAILDMTKCRYGIFLNLMNIKPRKCEYDIVQTKNQKLFLCYHVGSLGFDFRIYQFIFAKNISKIFVLCWHKKRGLL